MLQSALFRGNARLARAAQNAPAMRRGEADIEAVRLLQRALRDLQIASMRRSITADGTFDGDYRGETTEAVRTFQERNGLVRRDGTGDGIAGRNTLNLLDDQLVARGQATPAAAPAAAPPVTETPQTLGGGDPLLPSAARLAREYRAFVDCGGKPCQAPMPGNPDVIITNQCAIRLTIALGRSDIGFHLNPARGVTLFVHGAHSRRCGGHIEVPHEARAKRVWNHLRRFWNFERHPTNGNAATGRAIYERYKNRPAIIYFEKIGERTGTAGGDHIDFFDGQYIMNDLLNYAAPNEPRDKSPDHLFARAKTAIHVCTINP